MRTIEDIAAFIEGHPFMMEALGAVESLGLPDGWIGAGFVRNAVWRFLHGQPVGPGPEDLDVVYFDTVDARASHDTHLEATLREALPLRWSVRNQARMHARNGDAPYRDTADALRHWPETATAIAARRLEGRVDLLVPFGVGDLLSMILRPTPIFTAKPEAYRARLDEKQWTQRWPRVTVILPDAV